MINVKEFQHTILILTEEILDYNDQNPDLFLGSGALANSLFYYKLSKYKQEDIYIERALSEFEKVYYLVENEDVNSNMSLIAGYSGVAWLFQYYVNQNLLDYDSDFFSFFDDAIMSQCKKDKMIGRYDLFYGIIGYGSYFLQRSKFDKQGMNKYLNEIVQILDDMSIEDNNGLYWFSDMFSDEKNKINIGMAHGLPSIISFLTKVYAINKNSRAREMLIRSSNWLLKCKSNNIDSPSIFPYLVDKFNPKSNVSNSTRLAWCYGDLTIGYAIFMLGNTIKEEYFTNEGLKILENCALRKIEEITTGVQDKGFCHGTSGIYYIFSKLNTKFDVKAFIIAEKYWLEKTIINLNENIESLKTYRIEKNKINFAHDYGLINGYPGIGLSLLSHIHADSNEWDEIFML